IGVELILYVTLPETLVHPVLAAVSVRVTVPAEISVADGVYVAVKLFALGLYVPVPPLHVVVVGVLVAEPLSFMAGLLAHTLLPTPAFTTGAGKNITNTVSVTALQFPLPVVVTNNSKPPALIS